MGTWTEKWMCGDYSPVNRKTKSDRYLMSILKELFNALDFSRVFSTLDLRSDYHQLPLLVGNWMKIALLGIDQDAERSIVSLEVSSIQLKECTY